MDIGVITGAHGIRGQVKIKSFTTNPSDIALYKPLLNAEGTKRYELRIDAATKNALVATLKGVKDRNTAETLRGTEFFVAKSSLPPPDDDEFYYEDLVGLEIRNAAGETLGKVTALQDFGAGDVIEIRHTNGTKEMYPFTLASFPEIFITEGYILADLPEIIEAKGEKE
ncbi:MAG: ribosome maturation factor RimM [Alphaproteobacteria bacterium]|nr:ribosome maturation factor RimM [Alphaproteobacteria bacterium]